MSLNATGAGKPKNIRLSPLAEVLSRAFEECHLEALPEGCCEFIAERLAEAGYCKPDTYMWIFLDQLSHGLKDFRESLKKHIEVGTDYPRWILCLVRAAELGKTSVEEIFKQGRIEYGR